MDNTSRPLSPHLQIYRPQLTSVLSIAHRGTGIVLAFGAVAILYWLLSVAAGPEAYENARELFSSWIGRAVLLAFTFSLFYHLCNGVRHLFWDAGMGFELAQAYRSGAAVIIVSTVLTIATWVLAYALRGGA